MAFGFKWAVPAPKSRITLWQQIKRTLSQVHLVDKCLLVFMVVLLMQSTYLLLSNNSVTSEANHIDVIVRTSTASIFGYFLSGNFVQCRAGRKASSSSALTKAPTEDTLPAPCESSCPVTAQEPSIPGETRSACGRMQIITVTAIALFCLLVLIFARDFMVRAGTPNIPPNSSALAIASQFRDFISGSVGFLIGCPTPRAKP